MARPVPGDGIAHQAGEFILGKPILVPYSAIPLDRSRLALSLRQVLYIPFPHCPPSYVVPLENSVSSGDLGFCRAGSLPWLRPSRGAVIARLPLAEVPVPACWRCWSGLICPRTSSYSCYVTRTNCCAVKPEAGRDGITLTGSGSRRCHGWWTAAGEPRSSRSPRPRSCAGAAALWHASGRRRRPLRLGRHQAGLCPELSFVLWHYNRARLCGPRSASATGGWRSATPCSRHRATQSNQTRDRAPKIR